jgi:hypothetical protein
LRRHPVLGLEVLPGVGDELPVARMIDGLYTDNDFHQPGIVLADVLDQLGLCVGGSRNENRAGVCYRLSDSLKESVILRGVAAPDGVCLMVDVLGRMIGVQNEPFHISRAEMEYACLTVIDPNDRMKVLAAHGTRPFCGRGGTYCIDLGSRGATCVFACRAKEACRRNRRICGRASPGALEHVSK